jgi:hypothetical protein
LSLVAGKGQVHFKDQLRKIRDSLDAHGFPLPKLFFTDNPDHDKPVLEAIFPSLTENIVPPVESSSFAALAPLVIQQDVDVVTVESSDEMEVVAEEIMRESSKELMLVGWDQEWPVDRFTKVVGRTALIQISATERLKKIYLFRVSYLL